LLCLTGSAVAAEAADLTVTGTITPASCDIALGGGSGNATIAYGTQGFGTLGENGTKLTPQDIDMTITCTGKTQVGLTFSDNTGDSAIAAGDAAPEFWQGSITNTAPYIFGLGKVGEKRIGGLKLGIRDSVTADTAETTLVTAGADNVWKTANATYSSKTQTYTWAEKGTTTPASAKDIAGTIWVVPTIRRSEELPKGVEIPFEGNVTLTLKYL
jgi:hypothetical protein